jgi:P27 family predicted phage terminase small subunit
MPAAATASNGYAKEQWQAVAPELYRIGLLTVLDVGPFAAYCAAAARLRLAEESLEQIGKRDPRGHALTIKGSAGSQVTNPLLRIATQAMNDTLRIGAQFGLTPTGPQRLSGMEPPPGPNKFDGVLGS